MDRVAAGFWGAFFCTATLMLVISLAAFARSQRRVALMAGLTSVTSAAFVVAYLGWLPIEGAAEARVLAHVAVASAVLLALMLMSTFGMLRQPASRRLALLCLSVAAALALLAGWLLDAGQALALSSMAAFAVGAAMLVVTVRGARRGDRGGWSFVAGLVFMLLAIASLSWIALTRTTAWPVHAVAALSGIAYLGVIAAVLWARYSYLLELAEVMSHGPSYDPVTRMRSHSETGQMVGEAFFGRSAEARTIGVIAICIGNLYALENLHGRAAFNHALFVCAGRLRRCVPQNVEMGRLGEDGFLLLVRSPAQMEGLAQLAGSIRERLVRPVTLSTRSDPASLDGPSTSWVAEAGVGVLLTNTQVRPSHAVATARAMARTAWSYPSRLAFYDPEAGQIAELLPGGSSRIDPAPVVAASAA
jgi:GGDEF domain-containing protein